MIERTKGGLILLALGGVLIISSALGQETPGPKIFISADIEGIAHVVSGAFEPGQPEYERARILMTKEVNAAIEGALSAGAKTIVVADSHGNGLNLIPEELDRSALLVRSFPRPLDMMEGIDGTFDGVFLIGYHAKEGSAPANISHTMYGNVEAIKVNGTAVSEALFNAGIAGDFGVPVVMVSGDRLLIEEAKRAFGSIETVISKEALGYLSAKSGHPDVIRREIKEKSRKAVERINEFKPYKFKPPVRLEVTFKNTYEAEVVGYLPCFTRPSAKTVSVEVPDMKSAASVVGALGYVRVRE
jgi:D-amino peptidase